MSASVVNYCSMYSQNLALGKFASPADVGFYNRGQSIFLMPIQLVSQPIAQMILPSLSVLQDQKEKLLALLLRATWLVVLIVMPFTLFMVFFGDWAVVLLLGERWQLSGEVTQWLAVASVPYLASNLIARGNAAIGRPGRGVPLAVASLPFLLGGVVVYAPSGPVAVAIVYAAYRWLYYPLFLAMHLRGSGFLVREFLSSQLALLSICGLTSIILILLREIGNDLSGVIQVGYMCVCVFVSYITFLVVCRYFKYGREVVAWLHSKLSKQLPLLGIHTRTRR
jgi:O-antigen/teichoic acid export membrane protein